MAWTQCTVWPETETAGVAVQQARFSRGGGSFGFIDDSMGVTNLQILGDHIIDPNVIIIDHCEHGGPTWGPGQRTWCFNSDGTRVAYTRNEDGYSSLWVFDRATGSRHRIGHGVHGCLSWEGNTLAALRTGARTPQQVVVYFVENLLEPRRKILVQPADSFWASDEIDIELVEPTIEMAAGDNASVPFRLYKSHQSSGSVICWVHGGPNDQWQVTFRPQFTYWLSRGYDIAVIDHRGTTGHGREFMMSLNGHWGEYDSNDTVTVIRHLQATHGYLPARTILMGGSAGGLTALNAAVVDASLVAAVVAKYPVVDLAELLHGDDPFESHFMPALIGATPDKDGLARERSPHNHAEALIDTPILLFHGDQDTSVPIIHSERLRDAVNTAGGSVRLEIMVGEGHGFRNPVNILREFQITETFLTSVIR
jgi:dipeptidyl aminopeptidase/acylaminoacyl peptidase